MSEMDEAQELAGRAGKQAKNAGKNAGRAVRAAAEPALESVGEHAEEAAEAVRETARRVNPGALGRISSDTGVGFLAISVAVYAGAIAVGKFRQAYSGRKSVIQ